MYIVAFYNDFNATPIAIWCYMFQLKRAYFRNDRIDLHVGKHIKRSNWRQVYIAQRRNKHPASASTLP